MARVPGLRLASTSTPSSRPRRQGRQRRSISSAGDVDTLTIALPAAVHRRDGQVGAARPAHLAARRDGGPDPGLRPDPCRDHGDGRRVHGLPAVADVRVRADRARRSSPSSAPRPRSSPPPSAWCRTTSSASSPIRPAASSATCSSPPASPPMAPAMFHLFTHAFFKALLFLGAGSVIHAMSGEQDMRKMGGIWQADPDHLRADVDRQPGARHRHSRLLRRLLLARTSILEAAWASRTARSATTPSGSASPPRCMTAFYSWRLLFMTFHGEPRADHQTYGACARMPVGHAGAR